MKNIYTDWIIFTALFYLFLLPLMYNIELDYWIFCHIGISLTLGFFGGAVNSIRREVRILRKKNDRRV